MSGLRSLPKAVNVVEVPFCEKQILIVEALIETNAVFCEIRHRERCYDGRICFFCVKYERDQIY